MNLVKSTQRFSTETISDPYGVGGDFQGRISTFEDERSSGGSTRRRILEIVPGTTLFSTGCIEDRGTIYFIGSLQPDYYKGYIVRFKYPIFPSDYAYKIDSIYNILNNTVASTVVYAGLEQTKNSVADSEESSSVTVLNALFYKGVSPTKGYILFSGDQYYRIKGDSYIDGAGFKVSEVVQLDSPIQELVYTPQASYDVDTDELISGSGVSSVSCFVEDAYYCYEHTSERYSKLVPGDVNITVVLSSSPKAGDKFGDYTVLSIDPTFGGAYSCHCRA